MQLSRLLTRIFAVVVLLLTLAACSAFVSPPPTTFYTLTTLVPEPVDTVALSAAKCMTVSVGPVEITDYLTRPEIVVRSNANTLKLATFERWGGSLRNNVSRTLIDNLSLLLGPTGYRLISWDSPIPADYRMAFSVRRFERDETGKVVLEAEWQFFAEGGTRVVAIGSSRVVEGVTGDNYSATVEAMGRALAILSRELAAKIQELPLVVGPGPVVDE